MKRILAIIASALILLSFSSCAGNHGGKADTVSENPSGKTDTDTTSSEVKGDDGENAVILNGDTVRLTYESHHKDLFYKQNIVNFHSDTVGSFSDLSYIQNGDVIYRVTLVYFDGKSVEEAMGDAVASFTDKTVNGLEYKYFEQDFVYTDKTLPGHVYVYNFDGTTYTVSFISKYDMTSLETVFMNNVYFKKAN